MADLPHPKLKEKLETIFLTRVMPLPALIAMMIGVCLSEPATISGLKLAASSIGPFACWLLVAIAFPEEVTNSIDPCDPSPMCRCLAQLTILPPPSCRSTCPIQGEQSELCS